MKHLNIELLLFACPKPFVEPFTVIQQNAIKSWKAMKHNNVETKIYLLGDEIGVEQAAERLECEYIRDINKNEYGTPLVNHIFNIIKQTARERQRKNPDKTVVCCYINADIITFDEMLDNVYMFIHTIPSEKFEHDVRSADTNKYLLVGMRWDTDNVPEIDFKKNGWEAEIREYAKQTGESHGCGGIDYFIFSPKTFGYVYPFALGKFVWDRWLVGNIFRQDSVTVDITKSNFVIHQNGDWYQSCTGGATSNRKGLFDTQEVKINQSFDYYEKDIHSGTQWESTIDNDEILFKYKQNVPRAD